MKPGSWIPASSNVFGACSASKASTVFFMRFGMDVATGKNNVSLVDAYNTPRWCASVKNITYKAIQCIHKGYSPCRRSSIRPSTITTILAQNGSINVFFGRPYNFLKSTIVSGSWQLSAYLDAYCIYTHRA